VELPTHTESLKEVSAELSTHTGSIKEVSVELSTGVESIKEVSAELSAQAPAPATAIYDEFFKKERLDNVLFLGTKNKQCVKVSRIASGFAFAMTRHTPASLRTRRVKLVIARHEATRAFIGCLFLIPK
jgi:hypothetical protein